MSWDESVTSGPGEDPSAPPMLVRADSGEDGDGSDCSSQGGSRGVPSLESPPRMTRSVVSQSLFRDDAGSKSGASSAGGGGCGTHGAPPLDLLSQLLDAFSLNGPCCRQGAGACR